MFCRYNKSLDICKYVLYHTRNIQLKSKAITNDEYYKRDLHKQILQNHLGLTYSQAYKFTKNNEFITNLKNIRLMNTLLMLNKIGIPPNDIYQNPLTLNYMDSTIEHNVLYLREVGFTSINASMLLRFRIIVKKPISLLKLHGYIPEDSNVAERLLIHLKPLHRNLIKLDNFNEEMSITDTHLELFKKYLKWRLQGTDYEINKVFKTYDRFKYKSIQLLSENINFLIKEIKFTPAKLLKHGYLLEINPKHVKKLIEHFPKLGGEKIRTVLFKFPKLMSIPIENFYEILRHLQDFDINEEAVQKCYEIFTLSPDSVYNRLNELKKTPEFDVLLKNPRILLLLYCQNKAKLRLEILRSMNVKCASLHVLCASEVIFERYLQEGNDRTKGDDIVAFLSEELNRPYDLIREILNMNPHWYHIPTTMVKLSYQFLLDWGFPKDDIAHLPIILLYPKQQLEMCLKLMELKLRYNFLIIDNRQKLSLCLYEIEKKYHFSGNGIWNLNNKDKEINKSCHLL